MQRLASSLPLLAVAFGCAHAGVVDTQPARLDEAAWSARAQAIVRDGADRFRACYHREVVRVEAAAVEGVYLGAASPSMDGAVLVRLPIDGDGRVRSPQLEDDELGNPSVAQCLLEESLRLLFPPTPLGGPIELEVPLRFRLTGPAGH